MNKTCRGLIVAWVATIAVPLAGNAQRSVEAGRAVRIADMSGVLPPGFTGHKSSIEEAEDLNPGIRDERVKQFPDAAKPFGFQNRKWEELKALVRPGDEIWIFQTPYEFEKNLAGRAGVWLVRDGRVMVELVTRVN